MDTATQTKDTYYALIAATGEVRHGFTSTGAAASWLAEQIGVARSSLVLEDRSSSAGTELRYDVTTRGGESVGTIGDDEQPAPRLYVLSTGGGHASLRARPPMTADEVRAWVRRDHGGLSLSEQRRLSREIESALESGAGRGEAGCYSMGTAAGLPIVRWSIVETRA